MKKEMQKSRLVFKSGYKVNDTYFEDMSDEAQMNWVNKATHAEKLTLMQKLAEAYNKSVEAHNILTKIVDLSCIASLDFMGRRSIIKMLSIELYKLNSIECHLQS